MPHNEALLAFHQVLEITVSTRVPAPRVWNWLTSWCDDAGTICLSSVSWWARVLLEVPRFTAPDATWNRNRRERWSKSRPRVQWPTAVPRDRRIAAIASTIATELIDEQLLEGSTAILTITTCSKAALAELWASRQKALDELKYNSWQKSDKYWDGVSPRA